MTANSTAAERDGRIGEALNARLTDWLNTLRGHDAIHPNRSDCGGVGACLLMRTEHDAREDVTDAIERLTRNGITIALIATTREDTDRA